MGLFSKDKVSKRMVVTKYTYHISTKELDINHYSGLLNNNVFLPDDADSVLDAEGNVDEIQVLSDRYVMWSTSNTIDSFFEAVLDYIESEVIRLGKLLNDSYKITKDLREKYKEMNNIG